MRPRSEAKRYTRKKILKLIENEREYQTLKSELEAFQKLLDYNKDFKIGMCTALFSKKEKRELLLLIHQQLSFDNNTLVHLMEMINENRIGILDLVIQCLEELWYEREDIERCKVYSTIPLDEDLEKQLSKNLEISFNKKIILDKYIDESLIAGLKIQKGLIFYDFSINGNLKRLKHAILEENQKMPEKASESQSEWSS